MRSQMISWMMEDLLPEIQKNHKPEATILKFAHEHNLEPAIVAGLGQLYNTAKTLSYLEKSSNRGGTFKIIDVPDLEEQYMEVKTEKKASVVVDFDENDLPKCFAGLMQSDVKREKEATALPIWNLEKRAAAEKELQGVNVEFIKQAKFESIEEAREIMQKIARQIRITNQPFESIEQDTLALNGNDAKPALDQLANFLSQEHIPVKRAADAGPGRLVRDQHGFVPMVNSLQDCFWQIKEADLMLKESGHVLDDMVTETRHDKSHASGAAPPKSEAPPALLDEGGGAQHHRHQKQQRPALSDGGGNRGGGGQGQRSGGKDDGGYFEGINNLMDKAIPPILNAAKKGIPSMHNRDQRHVDTSYQDVQHLAVLQNLLSTDEVLADADHEKVVDLFNTVRQSAPWMASDPNVMRVVLRSAIQHDGVSPFDLKGFLDTEQSHQKVDLSQRQLGEHLYKGQNLPQMSDPRH